MRFYVPDWTTLDLGAVLIAAAAFLALFRFKIGMIPTLAGSAALGLVYYLTRPGVSALAELLRPAPLGRAKALKTNAQ